MSPKLVPRLRAAVPVSVADLRGMRHPDLGAALLEQIVDEHTRAPDTHGATVLKSDHRSRVTAVRAGGLALVVKEVRKGGVRRRLADSLRGSAASRAWAAAHALLAAGIGAAAPLAYLERSVLGVPLRSLLVSEDLRPARPAAAYASDDPTRAAEVLETLCALAVRLHRNGFAHGDLRAQHVFLAPGAGELDAKLIDLEDVRLPRRLSDAARLESLAQLNASLADELATSAERRRAFARYSHALPFRCGEPAALERLARMSLARAHLWRGDDCNA